MILLRETLRRTQWYCTFGLSFSKRHPCGWESSSKERLYWRILYIHMSREWVHGLTCNALKNLLYFKYHGHCSKLLWSVLIMHKQRWLLQNTCKLSHFSVLFVFISLTNNIVGALVKQLVSMFWVLHIQAYPWIQTPLNIMSFVVAFVKYQTHILHLIPPYQHKLNKVL